METNPQQFCDDLIILIAHIKEVMSDLAEENGLTPIQQHALYVILEGESTMGNLAASLHCDASNVTGIVDRLIAQDLVTSKPSPHDRRAKILALTPRGQQIMDTCMSKLPARFANGKLGNGEMRKLHEVIVKLSEPTTPVA